MKWPPWRRKAEMRQSSGGAYTDAIIARIVAEAGGNLPANPLAIAALEMASGSYARAIAAASLSPAVPSLTPAIRADIARSLIRSGESLYMIEVQRGAVSLLPVGSWDIRGAPAETTWLYRLDLFGPSGNTTRFVPSGAVLHFRYSTRPETSWSGQSPLQWAASTGALAANVEARLAEEAGGPVGHVLPVPQDPASSDDDESAEEKPLDTLRKDLAALKGRTAIVETTAAGWGEGRGAAPQQDWQSKRIGADPPATLAVLRSDAGQAVLGACGVPVSLFTDADGTSQRESWRRFVMGSVAPLSVLIGAEVASKLDLPGLRFDFSSLWAHDLAGRAQAFKQLRAGGMGKAKAARLAGLED